MAESNIKIELNRLDLIDKVLDIAKNVFNPSQEEIERYQNKEAWLKKIVNGGLLVSALLNDKTVAYALCEKKDTGLHIWSVGVLSEYRKIGLWKQMHELIFKYSIENNYSKLTLNTYKDKFPNMYNFVKQNGYVEISTEYDDMQKCTKSHFEKVI